MEAARKHKAQPGGSTRNQPCVAPPTGTITLKKLRWKHLPNPSTYLGPTPKMGGEGTKLANYATKHWSATITHWRARPCGHLAFHADLSRGPLDWTHLLEINFVKITFSFNVDFSIIVSCTLKIRPLLICSWNNATKLQTSSFLGVLVACSNIIELLFFHLCCTSVGVSFQYLETKLFIDYFRVLWGGSCCFLHLSRKNEVSYKERDQFYFKERTENITSAFLTTFG